MHDSAAPTEGTAATEPAALTIPQAARRLALSERKVAQLIKAGDLASYKVGSARRIPATAVGEFIARQLAA